MIKQQFGVQKTELRGMAKNRCAVKGIAIGNNLLLAHLKLGEKYNLGIVVLIQLNQGDQVISEV